MNTNNETTFANLKNIAIGFTKIDLANVFGNPEQSAAQALEEKVASLKKKPSKKKMKAVHEAVETLCKIAKDRGDHLALIEEAHAAVCAAAEIREKNENVQESPHSDIVAEVFGIGKKTADKKGEQSDVANLKVERVKPKPGIVLSKDEEKIISRIRSGEVFSFGPVMDEKVSTFMKARHDALSYLANLAKTGEEIDPFKVSVGVEEYAAMIKEENAEMGDEWEFASSALSFAVMLSLLTDLDEVPEDAQKVMDGLVQSIEGFRDQYQAAMVLKYQKHIELDGVKEAPARKPSRRK